MSKVLMPMYLGQHSTSAKAILAYGDAEKVWKALGYDVEIVTVDPDDPMLTSTAPGSGIGAAADILCFPYMNTDLSILFASLFFQAANRGFNQVPVFTSYINNSAANYNIAGVQGRVSASLAYLTAHWGNDNTIFTTYSRKYSDWEGSDTGPVTPLVGDAFPLTESNGTNIVAWKWESVNSPNGSPSYFWEGNEDTNGLVCLIQEAVSRGDIASPSKRKTVFFDFDDFPMSLVTAAEVTRIYNKMNQHGLKGTCGIHGSFDPASNAGEAQILNYLNTFTLIDHQVAGNTNFFDWDANLGETKLQMDTKHRANVSAMQALGTGMKLDSGGYRFFNQNAINNDGLALLSPDVSIANDPDETTPQAGYGLNIVRLNETSQSRDNGNLTLIRFSRFNAPQQGVMLANYRTISSQAVNQSPALDDATFNTNATPLWRGLMHKDFAAVFMSLATHNVDQYDGHDGGTAGAPGATQWERAIDFVMKCSAIYWPVDPKTISRIPTSFVR